jgi:hypothetical protein
MRMITAIASTLVMANCALAAETSCEALSKEKNLHGAALNSFMTKCQKDSADKCSADAKAKNLHGAAETSFTKKCVKDSVGSAG